jgi:hypothetical protein
MRDFLLSIGYDKWILPTLLFLPAIGAILTWIHGIYEYRVQPRRPELRGVRAVAALRDLRAGVHPLARHVVDVRPRRRGIPVHEHVGVDSGVGRLDVARHRRDLAVPRAARTFLLPIAC